MSRSLPVQIGFDSKSLFLVEKGKSYVARYYEPSILPVSIFTGFLPTSGRQRLLSDSVFETVAVVQVAWLLLGVL